MTADVWAANEALMKAQLRIIQQGHFRNIGDKLSNDRLQSFFLSTCQYLPRELFAPNGTVTVLIICFTFLLTNLRREDSTRLCNLFRRFYHPPSMASALIISLILFSLFSLSSPLPSETVLDAAEILSDNGFISMALTLELIAVSLLSQSSSLTVFSPTDAAFAQSGQPSLSLLEFHFLPLYLSQESLKSLALGTKIPTMLAGRSLTVTSSRSDTHISLNEVKINSSPFFDDGSLIIFGTEKFFDLNFQVPPLTQIPGAEFQCGPLTAKNPFGEAIKTLKSNGYTSMALFLESQIPGFNNGRSRMTVFATSDEALATHIDNFTENPSLYFRQILPCRILWTELVNLEEGTKLSTYSEGHAISVAKSSGTLTINGVAVFYPNMYFNEGLVVHGLLDVLAVAEGLSAEESDSEMRTTHEMTLDHW